MPRRNAKETGGMMSYQKDEHIHEDYMYVPRCRDCKERPDCTEDGTFYCGAVDQDRNDEDEICEYFEEG